MNEWEEKYDNLLYYYRQRGYKIEELQSKLNSIEEKLDSARFKIETELDPRIKSEQNNYDSWVTSGGSDDCFRNGDSGRCGLECNVFQDGDCEYLEEISDNVILEAYREYEVYEEEIDHRGLKKERLNIDLEEYNKEISDIAKRLIHLKEGKDDVKKELDKVKKMIS